MSLLADFKCIIGLFLTSNNAVHHLFYFSVSVLFQFQLKYIVYIHIIKNGSLRLKIGGSTLKNILKKNKINDKPAQLTSVEVSEVQPHFDMIVFFGMSSILKKIKQNYLNPTHHVLGIFLGIYSDGQKNGQWQIFDLEIKPSLTYTLCQPTKSQ